MSMMTREVPVADTLIPVARAAATSPAAEDDMITREDFTRGLQGLGGSTRDVVQAAPQPPPPPQQLQQKLIYQAAPQPPPPPQQLQQKLIYQAAAAPTAHLVETRVHPPQLVQPVEETRPVYMAPIPVRRMVIYEPSPPRLVPPKPPPPAPKVTVTKVVERSDSDFPYHDFVFGPSWRYHYPDSLDEQVMGMPIGKHKPTGFEILRHEAFLHELELYQHEQRQEGAAGRLAGYGAGGYGGDQWGPGGPAGGGGPSGPGGCGDGFGGGYGLGGGPGGQVGGPGYYDGGCGGSGMGFGLGGGCGSTGGAGAGGPRRWGARRVREPEPQYDDAAGYRELVF